MIHWFSNCMCAYMCEAYVRESMWACVCVCVSIIVTGTKIRSLLHPCDVLEADFSLEVGLHDPAYFLVFLSPSGHMLG